MIPFGRYTFDLLELILPPVATEAVAELQIADAATLSNLSSVGVGTKHQAWLDAGSVCVWVRSADGSPAAAMWWHRLLHVDRYLGSWSRPSEGTIYESGVMTRPDLRGKGFGAKLLRLGATELARQGVKTVRTAVAPSNTASIVLHDRAGFSRVGRLVGARIGSIHLERTNFL